MKTNKSYQKRLRVTRKGKVIARHPGQNHFNARASGRNRLNRSRNESLKMSASVRSRFLSS